MVLKLLSILCHSEMNKDHIGLEHGNHDFSWFNYINSSLIETILGQVFSDFVCFVQSPLSEGNDVIYVSKIADHVENSPPNKFMMLI